MGKGTQPEYVSCPFTPLLGGDNRKTQDGALGWQNGAGGGGQESPQ